MTDRSAVSTSGFIVKSLNTRSSAGNRFISTIPDHGGKQFMRDGQHEIVAAARCVHFAAQGQYRVGVAELAAYRDAQVELVQNRLQGIDQSGGGAVAGQGRY